MKKESGHLIHLLFSKVTADEFLALGALGEFYDGPIDDFPQTAVGRKRDGVLFREEHLGGNVEIDAGVGDGFVTQQGPVIENRLYLARFQGGKGLAKRIENGLAESMVTGIGFSG